MIGKAHGVRQLGPREVLASAPGGSDSSRRSVDFESDGPTENLDRSTSERDEQPASKRAAASS